MSLKDITDAEKPWFDYASNLLKIAAWVLAIAYAVHQQFRPMPPGSGFPYIQWMGIILASLFTFFLVWRLIVMSMKMSGEIIINMKDNFFNNRILAPLIALWIAFGMPAFTIAVAGEFVELYLEKQIPTIAQARTQTPAPDLQKSSGLAGPWDRPQTTSACPTGAVIAGTNTLCPIIPIEW
jgi:hypothetical protein